MMAAQVFNFLSDGFYTNYHSLLMKPFCVSLPLFSDQFNNTLLIWCYDQKHYAKAYSTQKEYTIYTVQKYIKNKYIREHTTNT